MQISLFLGDFYYKIFYYFTSIRCTFFNTNQVTFRTISDRCNMTYEHYMNQPMQAIELEINMIFAKDPQLINSLDRTKNHPLIRKYSQIPFNN